MRSCGGSWTRRRCRRCWRARRRPRCSRPATPRPPSSSSDCQPGQVRGARGRRLRCRQRARSPQRRCAWRLAEHRIFVEPIGRDVDGARFAVVSSRGVRRAASPALSNALRRAAPGLRPLCRRAIDRRSRRRRHRAAAGAAAPGFVCASAAMQRVADQIQRLQGNDLTVLITGESGTGKDLVARAIHAGSLRRGSMFLPFNCTSATRELADSQLFGHRRGSFTGAVADQPGCCEPRSAARCFSTKSAICRSTSSPSCCASSSRERCCRSAKPGRSRSTSGWSRPPTPTSSSASPREVPRGPLLSAERDSHPRAAAARAPRGDPSHLSTFFLREASERLGKPGVRLSPETLDLFDAFPWPGNVRQLRNEVQRAVAMTSPGGMVTPEDLSPVFGSACALDTVDSPRPLTPRHARVCRRWNGSDRRRPAAVRREHLGHRAGTRAHAARSLSENAATQDPAGRADV